MNILYIGNYRDTPGGWSNASQLWIKTLNKTNHNLAIRYYKYSNNETAKSMDHLKDLEQKKLDHIDIIIQNILPSNMMRYDESYNIGICYFESQDVLKHELNNWRQKLHQMDEIWVSTSRELVECEQAGLKAYLIPQSIDTWLIKKHSNMHILQPSNDYRFYSIGADSVRKNLTELILGYSIAFTEHDNVELVLKCSNRQYVNEVITNVTKLVPDRHPKIQLIFEDLTDEQIIGLHNDCNCYISTSSEESISRPLMDACAIGKPAIVTEHTSMAEIEGVEFFPSYSEFCLVNNPPVRGIYTYREHWRKPTVRGIVQKMQEIYKKRIISTNYNMNIYNCDYVAANISERFDEIKKHSKISLT